jgi:hypothetical protein
MRHASWGQLSCESAPAPTSHRWTNLHALAQSCAGTDAWLCSAVFPKMVHDVVGKTDAQYRGATNSEGVDVCSRKVQFFHPHASEGPNSSYWREMVQEMENCK